MQSEFHLRGLDADINDVENMKFTGTRAAVSQLNGRIFSHLTEIEGLTLNVVQRGELKSKLELLKDSLFNMVSDKEFIDKLKANEGQHPGDVDRTLKSVNQVISTTLVPLIKELAKKHGKSTTEAFAETLRTRRGEATGELGAPPRNKIPPAQQPPKQQPPKTQRTGGDRIAKLKALYENPPPAEDKRK